MCVWSSLLETWTLTLTPYTPQTFILVERLLHEGCTVLMRFHFKTIKKRGDNHSQGKGNHSLSPYPLLYSSCKLSNHIVRVKFFILDNCLLLKEWFYLLLSIMVHYRHNISTSSLPWNDINCLVFERFV